jgi:hypothetical protein
VLASQIDREVRWVQVVRDRWFDLELGVVTRDTVELRMLPTDQDGRAQCPDCRNLLWPCGKVTPEQAQLRLAM